MLKIRYSEHTFGNGHFVEYAKQLGAMEPKSSPNLFVIKDGFLSAFQFMSKKGNSSQLFNLNLNGFWDSCWIVFFVNAVVSTLASYGIKANIDGDIQSGILPRLLLITIIDICLFSILVNTIFEKIGKVDRFYKFIIPFIF